jgi:LmbE family N-acetylglucosaminyl deacetylase
LLAIGLRLFTYGDGFTNSLYEKNAFSGQKVLFLVPHEDDELAMAGAVIRLYVNGGAEVSVVFATNGDGETSASVRFREAITGLKRLGVSEENILFLGYGDKWVRDTYEHIYHAPSDEVVASESGRKETYGTASHPDFHTAVFGSPAAYTRANYLDDIRNVLRTLRPDTIFCIDLDTHPDHCVVSWLFEEAMDQLMKSDSSFRPKVYKGYAYSTAWFAPADFYGDNIESTLLPPDRTILNDVRYPLDTPNYDWQERVRFPLTQDSLGYTERASILFSALSAHISQGARYRANHILNGDEVFFERRTDSLLYNKGVSIEASSGTPAYLNDFKLVDTANVYDWPIAFDRCNWQPESGDPLKSVTVRLPGRTDISSVSLYDLCDPSVNVTSGTLTFSDGSTEKVGKLRVNGEETVVSFPVKTGITYFTFSIDSFEGDDPGLSELCAYGPSGEASPQWIKLMRADGNGDFLYRFTVDKGATVPLAVYVYPHVADTAVLTIVKGNGDVTIENGILTVSQSASPGSHTLRAQLEGHPEIYDEIEVVVPTALEKTGRALFTGFESLLDRMEYKMHTLLFPN